MDTGQRLLAGLIVVGGTLTLVSYTLVFVYSPAVVDALWGGVPEAARGFYTINMLLAAAGFFPMTLPFFFRTTTPEIETRSGVSSSLILVFYGLILFPSAAWLPLTAGMIDAPSAALWIGIRVDLLLVAAGSLGVWATAIRRASRDRRPLDFAAIAGGLFFCLQTVVLDALIWPAYYPTGLG